MVKGILLVFASFFIGSVFSQSIESKINEEEKKLKLFEVNRLKELEIASEKGVDALINFADKYPNTQEAQVALNVLKRFNAESKALTNKIAVVEKFYWVADGDRDWLNSYYETNRDWIGGGGKYNLFAFAKLKNKTNEKLKVKVQVNMNLYETTRLSFISSSTDFALREYYYIELFPNESKGLVVMYRNVQEGTSFGSGLLFSAGTLTGINTRRPIDLYFSYYEKDIPESIIMQQNDLAKALIAGGGNVKIKKNGTDLLQESIDNWFEVESEEYATLMVYFPKESSTTINVIITSEDGIENDSRKISSKGAIKESFRLKKNKKYKVEVPSSGIYTVLLENRITHLIVDSEGSPTVKYDY